MDWNPKQGCKLCQRLESKFTPLPLGTLGKSAGLESSEDRYVTAATHLRARADGYPQGQLGPEPKMRMHRARYHREASSGRLQPALHAGSALIRSTWGCQGALHVTGRGLGKPRANGSPEGGACAAPGPIPEVWSAAGRALAGRAGAGSRVWEAWRPRPVSWTSRGRQRRRSRRDRRTQQRRAVRARR